MNIVKSITSKYLDILLRLCITSEYPQWYVLLLNILKRIHSEYYQGYPF